MAMDGHVSSKLMLACGYVFNGFDELSVTRMKGCLVFHSVAGELSVHQRIKHQYFQGTCSDKINFRSTLDDGGDFYLRLPNGDKVCTVTS